MSKQKSPFNHGDKEARHRRACERLGTEDPRCILCHEINPHALQLHHVAGRAYDEDELVALCHNHHARVSDGQKDHPLKLPDCINPLEGLGHFDRGLAEMLDTVIEDLGPHPQREFLIYLSSKLKLNGALLMGAASNDRQNSLWRQK